MAANQQIEAIAQALDGVLQDGDEFFVRRRGDRVDVTVPGGEGSSLLADAHPELHGHLLDVNEVLANTGGNLIIFGMLASLALCVAIHMEWIGSVLGIDARHLRSFWVYGLIMVAAFFVCVLIISMMEWLKYRGRRGELLAHIRRAGLTRRSVVAEIQGDPSLKDVAAKLKTDRGADREEIEPFVR